MTGYRAARSRLRRVADVVLLCLLAGTLLYAVAHLPEDRAEGEVRIIDGDSLHVGGREVRLLGIDAPEARQTCRDETQAEWPCGRDATGTLRRLAHQAPVTCAGSGTDKYGRLLARCRAGGLDLNAEMVRRGFAVSSAEQDFAYSAEESEARTARRGLWRGEFQPPHEWRAAHE
ncbi:MAG: thermonuclease family protein [Hyphomicrobiales bacterium]